jgi:LacI family transcriptional regulator
MATIRDVANLVGVSTATVSHVLNGRVDRVGPETRERVLAAVRQLRYRPPALEDRQMAILTRNLGVVVPDITKNPLLQHGYFCNVLDGILEAAMFRGWSTSIFAERMWDDLGHAIRRSYDGRCDGLIIVAPSVNSELVSFLQQRGTPMVLIGTTSTLDGVSSVDIDNVAAGAAAAQHFLDLGHRRFAFLGRNSLTASSVEREQGFRNALSAAGVPARDIYSFTYEEYRDGQSIAAALLAMPEKIRPTALLGWHDHLAIVVMRVLRDRGVRVPEDISIMGVDASPESADSSPSLTTIRQPLPSLGKRAANLLIDKVEDHNHPDEVVRVSIDFVLRRSTTPAHQADAYALNLSRQLITGTNGGSH